MLFLKIEINGKTLNLIPIKDNLNIGSDSSNDVVLKTRFINNHHAQIKLIDNQFTIFAVNGSKIFYNSSQLIENKSVELGDVYSIGLAKLVVTDQDIDTSDIIENPDIKSFVIKDKLTIGRDVNSDIYIDNDFISRKHAVVEHTDDNYYLIDLNSKNGIYLNNERVEQKVALKNGDLIKIGDTTLEFKDNLIYLIMDKRNTSLIVSNVSAKISDNKYFKDINLTAKSGEMIAVIGGSGEGKSTLLKILSGYIKSNSGLILFNKIPYQKNYNFLKKEFSYLPQDDILYENLTIHDNLYYSYLINNQQSSDSVESVIDKILKIVGLSDKSDVLINRLSGGERKRVAIACEIVSDPSIIFLDEPTSSLDSALSQSLHSLFKAIALQNKIVFVATHDTTFLNQYDKIVVVHNNRIVFFGTPEQLITTYKLDEFKDIYKRLQLLKKSDIVDKRYKKFKTSISNSQVIQNIANEVILIPKISIIKQFVLLSKQYFQILSNSPFTLFIWLIQAPVIAMFLNLVYKNSVNNLTLSFALAISTFWYGANNSVREIVKFDKHYIKERHSSLNSVSFIFSRFFVLSIISFIETLLFVSVIAFLGIEIDFVTLTLFLILSSILGTAMGIMISTISSSSDKALVILPLALIPQLILSGLLVEFDKMSIVGQGMAILMPLKWVFEYIKKLIIWNNSELINFIYVFMLFIIIFIIVSILSQRRKDRWII